MTEFNLENLHALDKQQLVEFIVSLYGVEKSTDQRIERLLVANDPKQLASLFKKQIASLKRRKAFVPYSESFELGCEIEQLAQDIVNQLQPLSADLATELLEKLLATGVGTFERCDDSGGYVGSAYQDMVLLWLEAAKHTGKTEKHWIKKIKALVEENDYAIFDPLLPNADILLSNESLRELAFFYETALRKEADEWEGLRNSVNVASIAAALGDCALYERGLLVRSPKPNTLQLQSLIRFCLDNNDTARALTWLNANEDSSLSWLSFKIDCFIHLRHDDKLPDLCEQLLQAAPSLDNLQIAIEACPELNDKWQSIALTLLSNLSVSEQIELLLALDQSQKALHVALKHYDALKECHYMALTRLLHKTPESDSLLKIIFYRCLLLDLLTRGYSKAYSHGARYLKALRSLDTEVVDYKTLDSHEQLEHFLKDKHGRKRSFWALVE